MTLLILKVLAEDTGGLPLLVNATSTFCAGNDDFLTVLLWEIDPVARTLISTTTIPDMTRVIGVSPDGSHVFGNNAAGNACYWTSGTTTILPQSGSGTFPEIAPLTGMSVDGTTPVASFEHLNADMNADNFTAAYWHAPFTSYVLYLGTAYSTEARFASNTGAEIVGPHVALQADFFPTIFKWNTGGSTYTLLPSPIGSPNVTVRGISEDGTTVIGVASTTGPGNTNEAIYWDNSNALNVIGLPPGATFSDTFGVSSDGVTIGVNSDAGIYRWTSGGGFIYTGINDPVNPTLSADGGEVMTTTWWIDGTNTLSFTGLSPGQNIAADGRCGIGYVPGSPFPSAAVFFPGSVVVPTLSLDNVVVTSLATESPCTVALFDPAPTVTPSLGLRWSDTRGATFGNAVPQEFGTNPTSQPQWNRTGYARGRVFELFWSAAYETALNGAFVEVVPWES